VVLSTQGGFGGEWATKTVAGIQVEGAVEGRGRVGDLISRKHQTWKIVTQSILKI
jgi:hypothetical protein